MDDLLAKFTKIAALMCVRNTFLEDLHAGTVPIGKTRDFSEVKVIDGNGREIPWNELSRLDDAEMKKLMKEVVNWLYTFHSLLEDTDFQEATAIGKPSLINGTILKSTKSFLLWLQNNEGIKRGIF